MEDNKREVLTLKLKFDFEKIYLIVIFFFLLWAGIANLWDYQISHDFPFSYMASDTFQHQVRADSIKQMGNYRYEAPYIAAGYEDTIGFYPPVMYHLDVIMSYLSGLEIYDISYLLVFVVLGFSVLIFYFIMRRLNKHIAMIALPLSLLLFSKGPGIGPYALITWGSWPLIFGQFFLICFFWFSVNFSLKRSWIFLGIFLSAIALQHQPELIFAVSFLVVLFGGWLIRRELDLDKIKKVLIGGILSLLVSVYFLIIFLFTWTKTNPVKWFDVIKTTSTDQTLYLMNFGLALIFIVIGMVLAVFMLRKKFSVVILVSFFMLMVGLGNYIGLSRHAFKTRTLWPIYLSLFMGIAIYYMFRVVVKRWKSVYSVVVGVFLLLVFSGLLSLPAVPHSERFTSPGTMDPYHWQALTWFRENTDEDSKILFVYGDIYSQNALLRNTFRVPYMVEAKEYFAALSNRTIKRNIKIHLLGDHHGVHYAYRKSLFSYGYYAQEKGIEYFYYTERDMCDFDYVVLDKVSRQEAFAQYNMLIATELVKNDFIRPVFDNNVVVVLKNNNRGEDCLAEQIQF